MSELITRIPRRRYNVTFDMPDFPYSMRCSYCPFKKHETDYPKETYCYITRDKGYRGDFDKMIENCPLAEQEA